MIDSITRITLNLQETNTMVSIKTKRGDTSRKLLIHLSDGRMPYHISDDCYAIFTARKPDGKKIYNPCTIENNVIEYQFTPQTCAAIGIMKAEIRLYGSDSKMITSACFLISVYDTVFNDGDEIESETEIATLDALISEANNLIFSVETKLENGDFIGDTGPVGPVGPVGPIGPQGIQGVSGVYVGSGEMPEGYNVQIDPEGDATTVQDIANMAADSVLQSVADIQTVKQSVEPPLTTGFVRYKSSAQGEAGEIDSSNTVYHRTDYVEIPPMTTSIISNFANSRSGSDGYAFYDSDKAFISGGHNVSTSGDVIATIEVPSNARYIVLSSRIEYEKDGAARYLQFVLSKYVLSFGKSNADYNILFMGDSIIGKYKDDMSLPTKVAAITGANCYNAGFSGSCLAEQSAGAHPYRHLFSGWRLADAIVSGDFSAQLNAIEADALEAESDLHDNYAARLNTLQELNFANLDVLVLSYGTNDWAASAISHDNATDANPMGTTASFGGALRYFLEKLWSVYPHIRVVIGGIIWRGNPEKGVLTTWSDKWFKDGKLIQDYNAVAKSIAESYHIPHLDMYNNLGCNHLNWLNFFDSGDGTHPNDKGLTFMSKLYADQLGRM